ncbi:Twinfilin-1 [Candida tropicalis]
MSTQSGITSSEELTESFKSLPSSSALIIKISSDSTKLIPEKTITSTSLSTLFSELNSYISKEFPDPSYIIINNEKGNGNDKTFISFIPDVAKLRSKMLYASTRNTIINNLSNGINQKFSFTELDELTNDYYLKCLNDNSNNTNEGLLTEDEKILQGINNLSSFGNHGFKKKLASMGGSEDLSNNQDILYKFDNELTNAIDNLTSNDYEKLIVFNIDLSNELVKLQNIKSNISINQLIQTLESSNESKSPQYSIYNYNKNGNLAFIYSCPSGSAVKDRMIYASFKNSLINHLKDKLSKSGLTIDKNLEVGDLDELELSDLQPEEEQQQQQGEDSESISSASSSSKAGLKFNKPRGPRRR